MRAHAGLNHEKLVMLYGQHMSIFGSSNWTSSSDDPQEEHNCFCTDLTMFDWFTTMFDRKWNNSAGVTENSNVHAAATEQAGEPQPRQTRATGFRAASSLKWYAGPWAHKYDVLIGTDPNNLTPLVSTRCSDRARRRRDYKSVSGDQPASRDDLLLARGRAHDGEYQQDRRHLVVHDARHRGAAPVERHRSPAATSSSMARTARITGTKWSIVSDATAAGGKRLWNPNAGAAKITTAASSPSSYARVHLQRRRRQAVSPVDPRARRGQRLYERFGLCAVLEFGHVNRRRDDALSGRRRRPNTTWRTATAAACRDGAGRTTRMGTV